MALKYYDSYGNFMSNNIPVELQHVQCSNIHPLPRSIDIILNVTSCHLNGRRHPLCKPAWLSQKQLKITEKYLRSLRCIQVIETMRNCSLTPWFLQATQVGAPAWLYWWTCHTNPLLAHLPGRQLYVSVKLKTWGLLHYISEHESMSQPKRLVGAAVVSSHPISNEIAAQRSK